VRLTSARPSAARDACPRRSRPPSSGCAALAAPGAEHPRHRVDDVRLPRAVRPHDDGDAGFELEVVGSANDLKPLMWSRFKNIEGNLPAAALAQVVPRRGHGIPSAGRSPSGARTTMSLTELETPASLASRAIALGGGGVGRWWHARAPRANDPSLVCFPRRRCPSGRSSSTRTSSHRDRLPDADQEAFCVPSSVSSGVVAG